MKICKNCPVCEKEFTTQWTTCSKECGTIAGHQKLSERRKLLRLEKEQLYSQNPKLCLECNTPINYDLRSVNKFCNSSCFAKNNNRNRIKNGYVVSDESNRKRSQKLAGRVQSLEQRLNTSNRQRAKHAARLNKEFISITKEEILIKIEHIDTKIKSEKLPYCVVFNIKCEYCQKTFYSKRSNKKLCGSKQCLSLHSQKSGKISASKRVKRSKDEVLLYELCTRHFSMVISNHIIADGWDADIVLLNEKIAILWNGPWHYKEMPHKNHSLKQVQNRDKIKTKLFESLGWKVMVFEDRYYTPESAFINIQEYIGRDGEI